MENTACSPDFHSEHGLSLYLETKGIKILFDAGQSGEFLKNAALLGINLQDVDFAVLSHGHYDHGGGLSAFLERNEKAPVYVSRFAFGEHYNGSGKYIGLDPALRQNDRLIPVGEKQKLGEGITLISCKDREGVAPVDPSGLTRFEDGVMQPEDFRHEQYLLIEEDGKRILISGCSHRGIVNICNWIPCDVLIGGFHFMKWDPHGEQIRKAAQALMENDTCYYTGHCTGAEQYAAMKEWMGDRLHYISAGTVLEL